MSIEPNNTNNNQMPKSNNNITNNRITKSGNQIKKSGYNLALLKKEYCISTEIGKIVLKKLEKLPVKYCDSLIRSNLELLIYETIDKSSKENVSKNIQKKVTIRAKKNTNETIKKDVENIMLKNLYNDKPLDWRYRKNLFYDISIKKYPRLNKTTDELKNDIISGISAAENIAQNLFLLVKENPQLKTKSKEAIRSAVSLAKILSYSCPSNSFLFEELPKWFNHIKLEIKSLSENGYIPKEINIEVKKIKIAIKYIIAKYTNSNKTLNENVIIQDGILAVENITQNLLLCVEENPKLKEEAEEAIKSAVNLVKILYYNYLNKSLLFKSSLMWFNHINFELKSLSEEGYIPKKINIEDFIQDRFQKIDKAIDLCKNLKHINQIQEGRSI